MLAEDSTEPALVADNVAVFGYAPQETNDVALVMCTVTDPCAMTSPSAQVSVFAVIEQPGVAGLIDQSTPAPVGSGSFRTTERASPGPLLPTMIVNPIAEPASTVVASAVLLIVRLGASTTIVADSCTESAFVADAVAVFG